MEPQHTKLMEYCKSNTKKKVYSNKCLHIKIEIYQINNLTMHHKNLEKQEQTKCKVRRKMITKISAEINGIETNKVLIKYKRSMKCRVDCLKR